MNVSPERKRLISERLQKACEAHYRVKHGVATCLAEDIGVSPQTTSKWLRGLVMPGPERWPLLAQTLGVSAAWLFGESHETPEALHGHVDDEGLDLAGQAAGIVFPLVLRLKNDVGQKEVDALVRHAYQQLRAGKDPDAIAGEVASRLL